MSQQFSDTSNYRGLIQSLERELGFTIGYISGDTARLKEFTAEINLALDDYTGLAINSSGKFQWDDSNHTTYPILTGDLVANQRDYSFTADSDGNLILEIYRVFVRDSTTSPYYEIFPVDVQSDNSGVVANIADGMNRTGKPYAYDKTATGIFLDPIPSASVDEGLKIYVNREASYFVYTDTTKKPGIPGIHHRYLVVKASRNYARAHNLESFSRLEKEVIEWEGSENLRMTGKIQKYFSRRSRDDRPRLTGKKTLYI